MAKIYQKIEVEVSKPNFFSAIVAKQRDNNSRYLIVTLMNCGVALDVASGSRVSIRGKRSDGEKIKADGFTNGDGTVTVPLTYSMLEVVGAVDCEISIENSIEGSEDTSRLTTTTFNLQVEESFDGENNETGDVTADPNYAELVRLIEEVNKARPDLTYNPESENAQSGKAVAQAVADKQEMLISAENIKTINGESILGSGDINTIGAGTDKVCWCAMGDSITYGYASETQADGTVVCHTTGDAAENNGWVYKLANQKNWDVKNVGVSNTGWVHQVNGANAAWNKAEEVANETVGGVKGFNRFDIVTLMYGINDWGLNENLGSITDTFTLTTTPTTIVAGMRRAIETIIASNPYCKIVVITPMNRWGYTGVSDLVEEKNWALGDTSKKAGSLEAVFNGIKSVCEYYGVEMVDMTHTSIANRKNLLTIMPDKVHPTPEAHTAIARELSAKINFN